MKLCVPGFYESSDRMGAFSWFIGYCTITAFILMIVYILGPMTPGLYTVYFTLIGCSECLTLLGIISPVEETSFILYPIAALLGAVIGYFAVACNLPGRAKVFSKASKSFEAEREQVMKEQDLYDENCARSKAEKAAKEKAEKERAAREKARKEYERQERERKQREEQNRRSYQQKSNNQNRSSGSGSSSGSSSRRGNYTGSWNNTANSYFKDCKNESELKRRYRQLCKKLHPDNPGGNAESFRSMQLEYESLRRKMAG